MFSFSKLAKMMPVRPLRWLGGWLTGSEWNVGYHLPGKCCAFTTGLSLDGVGNVGKTFPDVTSIIFTSWLVNSLANFLLCPKVLGYCGVVQNVFNNLKFHRSDSKWLYSMKLYFCGRNKILFLWPYLIILASAAKQDFWAPYASRAFVTASTFTVDQLSPLRLLHSGRTCWVKGNAIDVLCLV